MKELYGEGVASHTGSESCGGGRKAIAEALTGVRAGRVLSREMCNNSGCRHCQARWKATLDISLAQDMFRPREVVDPEHARKLLAWELGGPLSGLERW